MQIVPICTLLEGERLLIGDQPVLSVFREKQDNE
jgi:hypothetical protein